MEPRTFLRDLLQVALDAVSPARCLPRHLPAPPRGRTVVLGAGKAAATMARTVEEHWTGPLSGLVVTRFGHAVDCDRVEVREAAHPDPDAARREAARQILALAGGLGEEDLALCLISGGGSALLPLPAEGLTLEDKQETNRALLRCGASISEINCVRKHLSAIKGGRLAVACAPARVVTLLISDVPGDDPAVIASGPTVPDPTNFDDALAILEKYRIPAPRPVIAHLRAAVDETPKPGDPRLDAVAPVIVANAQKALSAAAEAARQAGVTPVILGDAIEGEAREVAEVQAAIARQVARHRQPAPPPCVLISGGETTVTVNGHGRGGRNSEFLLALALALDGHPGVYALACDTDGIDGTEDNAGAIITPDVLTRAAAAGLDAATYLRRNDAYGFFDTLRDLVKTGPTRTNVNDLRVILVQDR